MPPKLPSDIKAIHDLKMGGQTLKSHQPYLKEAQSEQAQLPNPETGLPAGPSVSISHEVPAGGQPGDGTEAEVRLEMDAQQLQLHRADQNFQAYCCANEWARPVTEPGTGHRCAWEDILTPQDQVHQAPRRASSTEPIPSSEAFNPDPEAQEFKPGQ